MKLPSKSVAVNIKGNDYELPFPNTGEFIDIQSLKSKIANENYGSLYHSVDEKSGYARLLCDMIATYNVLLPSLKADINVPSILGLSMIESKILLDEYLEKYVPFFESWLEVLNKPKHKQEDTHKDA